MVNEALAPQPQPEQQYREPEKPDPDKDIYAYLRWQEDHINAAHNKIAYYENQAAHNQREQADYNAYINSMNRASASDPEFRRGYESVMVNRAAELMAPHYPNATHDQLLQAAQRGRIPAGILQQIEHEEYQRYKYAISRGYDPAELMRSTMVARGGYRTPEQRNAINQERRRQERQRAAEARKAEEAEQEWRRWVARRLALPGMTLEDVLTRREDRVRFYRGARALQQA